MSYDGRRKGPTRYVAHPAETAQRSFEATDVHALIWS